MELVLLSCALLRERESDRKVPLISLSPHRREPRLSLPRQTGRAIVMPHLHEARRADVAAPCLEIEEAAVALIAEAFLVVAARVRGEQHAAGLQGTGELAQHP